MLQAQSSECIPVLSLDENGSGSPAIWDLRTPSQDQKNFIQENFGADPSLARKGEGIIVKDTEHQS